MKPIRNAANEFLENIQKSQHRVDGAVLDRIILLRRQNPRQNLHDAIRSQVIAEMYANIKFHEEDHI